MTKSKQKTTSSGSQSSNYTTNYGYMNTPINEQMQRVIDMSNEPLQARVDPSIAHRYADMEEDVRRSYMDPQGAYTTPFVRQQAQLSKMLTLKKDRDRALRESYDDRSGEEFGRAVTAAGLTAPQLVGTGGSSSGTSSGTQMVTQSPSLLSTIGTVAGIGAA